MLIKSLIVTLAFFMFSPHGLPDELSSGVENNLNHLAGTVSHLPKRKAMKIKNNFMATNHISEENYKANIITISTFIKEHLNPIKKKLKKIKKTNKREDIKVIIKHISDHNREKKGKREEFNKVIIISIDGKNYGYLFMQEPDTRFHLDSWLITGIFRSPDQLGSHSSIKNISSAILAEAILYYHQQTKNMGLTPPPLIIQPITGIIATNAEILGFRKAPTCSCNRKKCTKKSFCHEKGLEYWNPSVRKWKHWLKEKQ